MGSEVSGWYGPTRYFGLHYDLHAGEEDTEIGGRCDVDQLAAALQRVGVDFVQTDCKGHPGYTSWFSKVEHASVAPHLQHDALLAWREASRRLGLPLHCHYSGIWDGAAAKRNPSWVVVPAKPPAEQEELKQNAGGFAREIMCPRGPYLEELMIPQMKELIDRYDVDGFWIDGDLWGAQPCYCERCRAAYAEETGHAEPPESPESPEWTRWWLFNLRSFERFVTRYTEAVHQHRPGVKVCSNWLQTFCHPGEPTVPTDWISGDNVWSWSIDSGRCESRFISTRGKHWDLMLWAWYYPQGFNKPEYPPTAKPPQMLMQEAATVVALGGAVQVYETVAKVRDGRLAGWRLDRLKTVGDFVKRRRSLAQDSDTYPQVAVLHSEDHLYATANGPNLKHNTDLMPVRGATLALVESQLGVDILDEWALLQRLDDFPVVVVPEAHLLSETMVERLRTYVERGGSLLVTGARCYERFSGEFLGVEQGTVVEKETYAVAALDGAEPVHARAWRLTRPTDADLIAPLYRDTLLEAESETDYAAATLRSVGKGQVAYIPWDAFAAYAVLRYPLLRAFIAGVVKRLGGDKLVTVESPGCVDVVMRRKAGHPLIIHMINHASGVLNQPGVPGIDEVPPVGPLKFKINLPQRPAAVRLEFSDDEPVWQWDNGSLSVTVPSVHIHAALVIDA